MSKSTQSSEQPTDVQVASPSQHSAVTTTANDDAYDDYLYYNEVALRSL